MSKQTEALKLALEALNRNDYLGWQTNIHVRDAIREALAEQPAQQQEPVADGWLLVPATPSDAHLHSMAVRYDHGLGMDGFYDSLIYQKIGGGTHAQRLESAKSIARQMYEEATGQGFFKLTSPPASKPWVGLTEKEKREARNSVSYSPLAMTMSEWTEAVQNATEAKLKEKNT